MLVASLTNKEILKLVGRRVYTPSIDGVVDYPEKILIIGLTVAPISLEWQLYDFYMTYIPVTSRRIRSTRIIREGVSQICTWDVFTLRSEAIAEGQRWRAVELEAERSVNRSITCPDCGSIKPYVCGFCLKCSRRGPYASATRSSRA